MHVVFLYGPPAVGKLTIAKELQNRLGYKLLHNHMLINIFEDIFSYDHPAQTMLVREFRLRIIEECIKYNLDLILTSGSAGDPGLFEYYDKVIDTVENSGGELAMVHLTADANTLLTRVEDFSRKEYGKNFGRKEMEEIISKYSSIFDKYPDLEHLTINTRDTLASNAAEQIIGYYHLQPAQ